jgi:Domain of unknown function (DUF5616)/AAA domain
MIFKYLEFHNFMLFHGQQRLEFFQGRDNPPDTGLYLVLAANNAGKTTLIRGLRFLLYGRDALRDKDKVQPNSIVCQKALSEAQNHHSPKCYVEARVIHRGTEYTLRRELIYIRTRVRVETGPGVYSHYHKVAETVPALRAIGAVASRLAVAKCRWWLDSPVDNSGRLKEIIQEVASEAGWPWEVELVTNPDRVLSTTNQIVCSSDHAILNRCQMWFNLARQLIADQVPQARIVDLGPDESLAAEGR